MAPDPEESPRAALHRLSGGYRTTQAVYVMARLGVADRLASGPKDALTLAGEVGADPDRLHRVLRMLVSLGVLTMDELGRFGLSGVGELLRSDVRGSMLAFALFQGEEPYRAFGELLHTVQNGETAFDHIYGTGHFEYLAQHPEARSTFHRAMASTIASMGSPLRGYEMGPHKLMVDVGGGNGELLSETLRSHPSLRGLLFDLPEAVKGAQARFSEAGVADRCEVRTGSAFESVPAGGDLYVMSRVLHDWPDERARLLLTNCHRAMKPDGTLLLIESVLPEPRAPAPLLSRDLMMMVMNGGRERTEREWRSLLESGGFALSRVHVADGTFRLIEASPLPPHVDQAPGAGAPETDASAGRSRSHPG